MNLQVYPTNATNHKSQKLNLKVDFLVQGNRTELSEPESNRIQFIIIYRKSDFFGLELY